MSNLRIIQGDALTVLKTLPDESVHCCVTSPPYWGLRDYGHTNQIGLEKTPQDYVEALRATFAEVHRVLRDDGTLWLNLGDSYVSNAATERRPHGFSRRNGKSNDSDAPPMAVNAIGGRASGLKPKDLVGIPWRVAFALQFDGWWLRSDIIWAKANCMPESVTDRPTRSHEYIFLLSKSSKYFYDQEAIKEPCIYDVNGTGTAARKARAEEHHKAMPTAERNGIRPGGYKNSVNFDGKNHGQEKQRGHSRRHNGFNDRWDKMEHEDQCTGMRNKRDVWTIAPANYPEAHFATFPTDLIKPCIMAGCPAGGTVLDPFLGSGTTAAVALDLGRSAIGIELSPEYVKLAEARCSAVTPGFPNLT